MTKREPKAGRAWTRGSLGLLLLIVVAAVASLPWTVHDVYQPYPDSAMYIRTAYSLLEGTGYSFLGEPFTLRPPGFPVLIAPVLAAFGTDFLAINTFVSLLGIVGIALAFVYFRVPLGDVPAAAVAIAIWINPLFQRHCNEPMSDVPGAALVFAVLIADRWARREPHLSRGIVLGIVAAAATYVRTVSILLLPAILLSRLLAAADRRAALRQSAVPLAVCVALLLPWTVRDQLQQPDEPAERTHLHSQWTAMWFTDKGDPESRLISPAKFLERIPRNLGLTAKLVGSRARHRPTSDRHLVFGALVLAGLPVLAWRRRDAGALFALAMLLVLATWHAFEARLALTVFLLTGGAAVWVGRTLLATRMTPRAAELTIAAAVLLLAVLDARFQPDWSTEEEAHRLRLARAAELEKHIPPDAVVASGRRAWYDAIYLDRQVYGFWIANRRAGTRGVAELLEKQSVDTVLMHERRRLTALRAYLHDNFSARTVGDVTLFRRDLASMPSQPNVILISIDSLRADHLGCYGHPPGTSPMIDSLARSGHLFASAVAQAPWTLPSHASLLTSLYSRTHRATGPKRQLPDGAPTLSEALRQAGYETHAIVSGPFMRTEFGFSDGFDTYDDTLARVNHEESHGMVTSEQIHGRAVEILDSTSSPFFLFLHYWDVHYDYIPPTPYDSKFDPDYGGDVTSYQFYRNPRIKPRMDPRDLQHIIALYDGEIAWVDAHLRRLVAALKARGLFDDAIFVLTADHGDEFFEHGRKGHQHSLYEELLHVPLLVRGAGLFGGLTHEERTPLIDVMPTLLEATGTTIPPGLHGSSFWPVLRGGARDPRPVFAETTKALKQVTGGSRIESWCVYDGAHKLILFEEDVSPAETYDLSADPGEIESLGWSDSESEIFDVYRTWLDRVPLGKPQKNDRIDSETKRTLEALGYVGD